MRLIDADFLEMKIKLAITTMKLAAEVFNIPNKEVADPMIETYEAFLKTVKNLPTEDADDGWIPCSKRLPKEHRKVWVTTKWGEVTDGKRSCIPNIWFIRAGSWNARDNEIIAWKPYSCPKPYESKESET